MSLPPLPVGVPTIRQSSVSVEQMTKHLKKPKGKKGDTIHKPLANLPPAAPVAKQPKQKNRWMLLLLFLLLLGIGGWYFTKSGFFASAGVAASTFTSAPPTSTEPVQPTQTLIQPSATPVPSTATATSTPTASPTPTPLEPTTAAPTLDLTLPILGISTIPYPDGNNLTLFWNDTSFNMLNRSDVSRSLSGFAFERLDKNEQPTDTLPGYRLESRRWKYISSDSCVSIKIYNDQRPPYLDPADCLGNYSSIIQPIREEEPEIIFWDTQEGSRQFRVLWLGEEVARCEISAGTCEIYIP
jgi:hypothetical protein